MNAIATGAFCAVFDLEDGTVLKAFFESRSGVAPDSDATLVPRIGFAAEKQAYVRLKEHPDLEIFTARFFGTADPMAYPLESKRDFTPGCGLILERIPGQDVKMHEVPEEIRAEAEGKLTEIKERVGVDHLWDASCFVPGSRAPFTLIDFATPSNRLAALDGILLQYGCVPDDCMARLGL